MLKAKKKKNEYPCMQLVEACNNSKLSVNSPISCNSNKHLHLLNSEIHRLIVQYTIFMGIY